MKIYIHREMIEIILMPLFYVAWLRRLV